MLGLFVALAAAFIFIMGLGLGKTLARSEKPSPTPVADFTEREPRPAPSFDGPQVGDVWRLNNGDDPWAEIVDAEIVDVAPGWVRFRFHRYGGLFANTVDSFTRIHSKVSP